MQWSIPCIVVLCSMTPPSSTTTLVVHGGISRFSQFFQEQKIHCMVSCTVPNTMVRQLPLVKASIHPTQGSLGQHPASLVFLVKGGVSSQAKWMQQQPITKKTCGWIGHKNLKQGQLDELFNLFTCLLCNQGVLSQY
jgi:hypothetical protein